MTYWLEVAKRAGAQAAKDVRLEKVPFAVVVISQLILAMLLLAGVGRDAANLPTRIATAALPLLIFLVFFLARMTTTPVVMDAELRARIAELEAVAEDQYWAALGGDNARNHARLHQLRELYKLGHDDVSPDLHAGLAWPPVEWLNDMLAKQGLPWRVARIERENIYTRMI
jgi:hypothetical protein